MEKVGHIPPRSNTNCCDWTSWLAGWLGGYCGADAFSIKRLYAGKECLVGVLFIS